jgi:hypothetical protein
MVVRYNRKGAYHFEGRTNNKIFGIGTASLEKTIKEVVQRNDPAQQLFFL